MKKLFLTGSTGFIGRNIHPYLREKYIVLAPNRTELNLFDVKTVREFLKVSNFDVIIHAANPTGFNPIDKRINILEDSLKIFTAFEANQDYFGKMLYFGSGAEFDKREPIISIEEETFGRRVPVDQYGLAKYIMNRLAQSSKNIYNLRLFGCYGSTDPDSKFITHSINCAKAKKPITIRQNCIFDYLYVGDLTQILEWFIKNTPRYHDYNICTGEKVDLLTIANIINDLYGNKGVEIQREGMNNEYSASNRRLLKEIQFAHTNIYEGVRLTNGQFN